MPKLRVTFEHMFLLIKSNETPVVLFPNGLDKHMEHYLFILEGRERTLRLCGADAWFFVDYGHGKNRLTSGCGISKWPDDGWLLDFNNLGAKPEAVQARKDLYSQDVTARCPTNLNGRLYMPAGEYKSDWNLSQYGDARWHVSPTRRQYLTDIMKFECEIDRDASYGLGIEVGGRPAVYETFTRRPGKDIDVWIYQQDRPSRRPAAPSTDPVLTDFELLYDLVCDPTDLKPPTFSQSGNGERPNGSPKTPEYHQIRAYGACTAADTEAVLKSLEPFGTDPELPICGGGHTDPEP